MFSRYFRWLVDRPAHFIGAEHSDDPLDLPPVAEARDIAVVAAALGARRGLEARIVAEPVDEVRCIVQRHAAMDEGSVHGASLTRTAVSRLPTNVVNTALSIFRLAAAARLGMGAAMRSTAKAGGCFLTVFILAGFPLGLAIGNPMKGILIGTGVGIALALVTWLIDRRRA
jgi:hypothetical protein